MCTLSTNNVVVITLVYNTRTTTLPIKYPPPQAVQFELDIGNTEYAIACIQTVLEFNIMAPSALPPLGGFGAGGGGGGGDGYTSAAGHAQHKRRLFEVFWESGVPLLGDVGAQGWARFVWGAADGEGGVERGQHGEASPTVPSQPGVSATPAGAAPATKETPDAAEVGGWSGWVEVDLVNNRSNSQHDDELDSMGGGDGGDGTAAQGEGQQRGEADGMVQDDDDDSDDDDGDVQEEDYDGEEENQGEDEETLLARYYC